MLLAEMLRYYPELRDLSIFGQHHSDTALLKFPRSCPLLETLKIVPADLDNKIFSLRCSIAALTSVLHCCTHLTSLSIGANTTIGDVFLRILVTIPTRLKTLSLNNCIKVTGEFAGAEMGSPLELTQLKKLHLFGCDKMSPIFITRLLRRSRSLMFLHLANHLNNNIMLIEVLSLYKFRFRGRPRMNNWCQCKQLFGVAGDWVIASSEMLMLELLDVSSPSE
ncbi:hypothetical protein BC938DRAFT_481498 [Jimgerdemannia flammicorona]|uniref:F-box domain-containing protein n=1 Tax=Jimgerdemannia flammicorona TaxID=994334 RepID=A0A433QG44_9FUNG|nr:hypothetical protein BC938DRAFT_481498 [Jimgerdemannia flammicorona]